MLVNVFHNVRIVKVLSSATLHNSILMERVVEQSSVWSLSLIMVYRFSMGLESGEFSGHSKAFSPFFSENTHILLEVLHGAKSRLIIQILS